MYMHAYIRTYRRTSMQRPIFCHAFKYQATLVVVFIIPDTCIVLYCIVLYCIVLYCIALHCIALHCTALYCTVLYCTVLYCTVLYCTVLYCTVMYCIWCLNDSISGPGSFQKPTQWFSSREGTREANHQP